MDTVKIGKISVYGFGLNAQTGCAHYHSPLDIVAIRFKCCGKYYACYLCHLAAETHSPERWDDLSENAVLCGACGKKASIQQYMNSPHCLNCNSPFNPRCRLHWNLYFSVLTHCK